MIEFLKSIKKRDPAAANISYLEILLCYPGVHALFFHRISNLLYRLKIPILPRFIANISKILTGIEIHPAVKIGKNLFIDHGHGVVIGETSIIGDNVTIYQNVTLGGWAIKEGKRHPTLGNNVVIGAGAKIMGNIRINSNSKVGVGAIVVNDLAEGKVMVAELAKEKETKNHKLETIKDKK